MSATSMRWSFVEWLFGGAERSSVDRDRSRRDGEHRTNHIAPADAERALASMSAEDAALVARIRGSDDHAFEHMFHTYYARLCVFASAYVPTLDVAEDLVSDVFLRIWTSRENFAPSGTLEAYLFRAVRNRAANEARDVRRRHVRHTNAFALDLVPGVGAEPAMPDAAFDMDERTAALWEAIAAMPPQRRLIMILRWQYGKSFAEIAEALGMSRPAVQMQVGRAVKSLRVMLGERQITGEGSPPE